MTLEAQHIGYETIWGGKPGEHHIETYTMDDLTSQDPEKQRSVQAWLNGIDEPWSDTAVSFHVHPSYKTGKIPENEQWVCDYCSIVYDGIESHVCTFAATAQEAFEKCVKLIDTLLTTYYIAPPDDEDDEE